MYLFRTGFKSLERIHNSNVLSSKLAQAVRYLNSVAKIEEREGEEALGEGVILKWNSRLIEQMRPTVPYGEAGMISPYELYLYEVEFSLNYKEDERDYRMYVFRYKTLISPEAL